MKFCNRCHLELSLNRFTKNGTYCIECTRIYNKKWYKKKKQKVFLKTRKAFIPDLSIINRVNDIIINHFGIDCIEAITNKSRKKNYFYSRMIIINALLCKGYTFTFIDKCLDVYHGTSRNSNIRFKEIIDTKYPNDIYEILKKFSK